MEQPDPHLAPAGSTAVPGPLASPWLFVHDDPRPHLHPVTTPAGHVLTTDAPADHPWHHGLWFAIKFVDGDNYWEQMGGEGDLRVVGGPVAAEHPSGPGISADIDWVRPGTDEVVLEQALDLTAVDHDDPAWSVVDISVVLRTTQDRLLDRTPYTTWGGYGGLAFRGRSDLVDSRLLLADGSEAAKLTGTRSGWCDLTGTVPEPLHHGATATVGIAILDGHSPGERPVPWYGSTRSAVYGTDGWSNFLNAAFLWDGPMTIRSGVPLELAYRVIAHDGPADPLALEAELARFRALLDAP